MDISAFTAVDIFMVLRQIILKFNTSVRRLTFIQLYKFTPGNHSPLLLATVTQRPPQTSMLQYGLLLTCPPSSGHTLSQLTFAFRHNRIAETVQILPVQMNRGALLPLSSLLTAETAKCVKVDRANTAANQQK